MTRNDLDQMLARLASSHADSKCDHGFSILSRCPMGCDEDRDGAWWK